jgi:hypothetical protein
MRAVPIWVCKVLVLSGFLVLMVGLQWQPIARLMLFFFDIKLKAEIRFWLLIVGVAMFVGGSALFLL